MTYPFPTEADLAVPFAGAAYDEARDRERLETQIGQIEWLAKDGNWRTVQRLALELRRSFPAGHFPENSVQAQLRNLRKVGYTVERRHVARGLFEYRLLRPANPGIGARLRRALGGAR